MAGKYEHVIHSLPRTFGTEVAQQEKIDAVKAAVVAEYREETQSDRTPPASYLAQEWANLRTAKDKLEDQLSVINCQIEALTQMMVDQYEAEGITKLNLETGEAPRVQYEPYASVEDADTFRKWCLEHGYERSLALPWQTRTSIAKERLLSGEQLPPGLKLWNKPKIVKR